MKLIQRRILALVLSLLLTLPFAVASQANEIVRPSLRFNQNGTFKILFIADLQHWGDEISTASKRFLHALVQNNHRPEADEPLGLVVLGGDNHEKPGFEQAWTNYESMIRSYMDIFAYYDIPVAVVFGNHDREAGAELFGYDTKSEQVKLYNSYPNTLLMEKDPTYTIEDPTVRDTSQPRFGGYNLPIFSSDGIDPLAYNLWFFDTGRGEGVSEASMKWYEWKSGQLRAANGGTPVPSLAFQHIPVPEVRNVTVRYRNAAGNSPTLEANYRGTMATPVRRNSEGQYARMERQCDVKGMFFGHMHEHHFSGYPRGGAIRLVNNSSVRVHDQDTSRFYCVGRVIVIDEATKRFITRTNLVGGAGNNTPTAPAEIVEPRAGACKITFGNLYNMATSYTETHTSHDLTFVDAKTPSCSMPGEREVSCAGCDYKETQSVATTHHSDANGDGVCDDCNAFADGCGCGRQNHKNTFGGRIACFFCKAWSFVLRYVLFGWIWMG